ncbi:hypothetical protein HA402_013204 [Bradysia odoriphaga]|nr:hypothetical protein HA402_013204 [Bradysia odoriphaga]
MMVFSAKKKRSKRPIYNEAALQEASDQLSKLQWNELMIASIRKLNEDGTRVVKYRLCTTLNALAKEDFDLAIPISETVLLRNLDRAIDEGILTSQKNGSIISYGIAGEKAVQIDLTVEDPLEDGKILAAIVKSLLIVRRNEGQVRGFKLSEIINLFESANGVIYPECEDKTSFLENVITGALKKGCISGHIRKLEKEYYVAGKS